MESQKNKFKEKQRAIGRGVAKLEAVLHKWVTKHWL